MKKYFFTIVLTLLLLALPFVFTSCLHECWWVYDAQIDYNVDSITVNTYDASSDDLLTEVKAGNVDYSQTGSKDEQSTRIVDIVGADLYFRGTVSGSNNISVHLVVGEKFEELEVGGSVIDTDGSYLSLSGFSLGLDLDVESIKYELEDTVEVSRTSEGYQAIVKKYPYLLNDEGEKEYYDTMEAVVVFDNVEIHESYNNATHFCRN